MFDGKKVLLVKEKDEGLWSLPGGFADVNFSPSESIIKEIFEESGLSARVVKLVAIHDKLKHTHPPELPHTYKIFFLCEPTETKIPLAQILSDRVLSKDIFSSIETSDVDLFEVDNLPPLSLNRNLPEQIEMLYKHKKNLLLATEFD